MSRSKCCVPKCSIAILDNVSLHKFPNPVKDPERFRTWVSKIGGEIVGLDNNTIYRTRKVCHKHFAENFKYCSNGLSKTAVPELHLSGPDKIDTIMNKDVPIREVRSTITTQVFKIDDPIPSTSTLSQNKINKKVPNISQGELVEVKKIIKIEQKPYRRIIFTRDLLKSKRRKSNPTLNAEESQSHSLLAPKRRTTENSGIQWNLITVPKSEDTQKSQKESVVTNENSELENVKYECVLCNKISNQEEFNNDYYGQLIASELKFVEPCMRTHVYAEIFQLLQRSKYRHMPLDNM